MSESVIFLALVAICASAVASTIVWRQRSRSSPLSDAAVSALLDARRRNDTVPPPPSAPPKLMRGNAWPEASVAQEEAGYEDQRRASLRPLAPRPRASVEPFVAYETTRLDVVRVHPNEIVPARIFASMTEDFEVRALSIFGPADFGGHVRVHESARDRVTEHVVQELLVPPGAKPPGLVLDPPILLPRNSYLTVEIHDQGPASQGQRRLSVAAHGVSIPTRERPVTFISQHASSVGSSIAFGHSATASPPNAIAGFAQREGFDPSCCATGSPAQ
jgi:hypothetical protein